jgi:hypothetical protein
MQWWEHPISLNSADPGLKLVTWRLKDANVYLFFNEGAQASVHTVSSWCSRRVGYEIAGREIALAGDAGMRSSNERDRERGWHSPA